MRILMFLVCILIVLASCHHTDKQVGEYNLQKSGNYTLVDSTNKTDSFYIYNKAYRSGWYPAYYLGEAKSSYTLGSNPLKENTHEDADTTTKTVKWTNNTMRIFVDTTLDIAHKVIYDHYDRHSPQPPLKANYITDSVKHYKAYPVIITNLCDSALYLGHHNYVNFIVRQAMNDRGRWVTIETHHTSFECNGCRTLLLRPHQVMIAKLLRTKGDFKTTCRLRFGNKNVVVYSNTFTDNVDKRVFTDSLALQYNKF